MAAHPTAPDDSDNRSPPRLAAHTSPRRRQRSPPPPPPPPAAAAAGAVTNNNNTTATTAASGAPPAGAPLHRQQERRHENRREWPHAEAQGGGGGGGEGGGGWRMAASLERLPPELLDAVVCAAHLRQADLGALACVSRALHAAAAPHLRRAFRCTTCAAPLFRPQQLAKADWRLVDASPLYTNALPRRSFVELDAPSIVPLFHGGSGGGWGASGADCSSSSGGGVTAARPLVQPPVPAAAMHLDERVGVANFMVMRHLRQNNLAETASVVAVRIVRCSGCGVYVGFVVNTDHLRHGETPPGYAQYPHSNPPATLFEPPHGMDMEHSVATDLAGSSDQPQSHAPPGSCDACPGYAAQGHEFQRDRKNTQEEPASMDDNDDAVARVGRDPGRAPSDLLSSQSPAKLARAPACASRRDVRMFVSRDSVQLFDGYNRRVNLRGEPVEVREEKLICCRTQGCGQVLFDREDLQPWSHVLASTRLSDLDAFLEYEHAWGPGRPAMFARRLAPTARVAIRNVRWTPLRQGMMKIGELICSGCMHLLGWQFLAEPPNGPLRNYDQVGRYGVLRDAVMPNEPRLM